MWDDGRRSRPELDDPEVQAAKLYALLGIVICGGLLVLMAIWA